jgi:hypothetical protein
MALPILTGGDELSYQLRLLAVTPSPWSVGRRIRIQLRNTCCRSPRAPSELLVAAVPLAVLVFVLGFAVTTRAQPVGERGRRGVPSRSPLSSACCTPCSATGRC